MPYLKQSTAVTLKIGPFLDDTDGKTAETALTIAQADVRLSKNGGDIAQKTEATSCTHDELGIYGCPVDATDTATLGRLQLWVHESGALPVWHEYTVLPANVYDSMFSTDKLEVDLLQIGGAAQSATDLKDFADDGYDPVTDKVQGVVLTDTCTTNTDMVGTANAALASVCTEARLAELAAANLPTDIANVKAETVLIVADTNELQLNQGNWFTATGFNTTVPDAAGIAPTAGEIKTAIEAAGSHLTLIKAQTDLVTAARMGTLTDWINGGRLDLILDIIAADTTTDIPAILTAMKGATFDTATDSLESLRDRGDAAWITGGGGALTDILNIQALIPNSIDLADIATVRIALGLTNMLDNLPTTAEITPGTITIDRKAIGQASWTNIVNAAACSEAAGLVYYDEVFDGTTGYGIGDSIRITFKSQKITVAANDFEITGTDGWTFQTYIREKMNTFVNR